MEDEPKLGGESALKKVASGITQRGPRRRLEHLDKLSQGLDTIDYQDGQTLDEQNVFDKVTYESERLRSSHSEASSRRNSDGRKSKKQGFRTDGTNSEPPTASVLNQDAWNEMQSSTSTTRTELSFSDTGDDLVKLLYQFIIGINVAYVAIKYLNDSERI